MLYYPSCAVCDQSIWRLEALCLGPYLLSGSSMLMCLELTATAARCKNVASCDAPFHPTGYKFFPGYINEKRRQVLDAAALQWHANGQRQKASMRLLDNRSAAQSGLLMPEAQPIRVKAIASDRQVQMLQTLTLSAGWHLQLNAWLLQALLMLADACLLICRTQQAANSLSRTPGEGGTSTHSNFHELLLILFTTTTIVAGSAAGVQHLCDIVECKLPAEDWYLSNKPTKKPLDNPGGPLSGAKLRPK